MSGRRPEGRSAASPSPVPMAQRSGHPLRRGTPPPRGRRLRGSLFVLVSLLPNILPAAAEDGSMFYWTRLKYGGQWDPYHGVWLEIDTYLRNTTSIPVRGDRVVAIEDAPLAEAPVAVLTGKEAPPELTAAEVSSLRRYLLGGGFLWIDDASGQRASSFDRWVRREVARILPDAAFEVLPSTHAVYRSFYLLRSIGGRVIVQPSLEGVVIGSRTVLLYTRNDLEGAWVRDSLGNYLFPCVPGGEVQRNEARKLTVNIVMYALTGSYKLDAVHQPFILEKLRSMGGAVP